MNNNENTLSTNKLVVLLVFLCAAIMTSVFVYRATHQNAAKQELANNAGLVFPAPRDLKEFNLVQANGESFTLANLRNHWSLVFFGFTHCAEVCPTTLNLLQHVYEPLKKTAPGLQVVFVSLDPERDGKQTLSNYMNTYNHEFIGTSGKIEDLRKLQGQMGVYAQKKMNANGKDYQIQHTSSIMLVNPKGQWVGFINYGTKPNDFINAVEQVTQS